MESMLKLHTAKGNSFPTVADSQETSATSVAEVSDADPGNFSLLCGTLRKHVLWRRPYFISVVLWILHQGSANKQPCKLCIIMQLRNT